MVQKQKTYNEELLEMRSFLSEKRKISSLAKEVGVTPRTVYYAFDAQKPEDLRGKKIDVIKRAKEMVLELSDAVEIHNTSK